MWSEELDMLKSILSRTPLTEAKKWGIPVYTLEGKNVVGIAGFKNHFALWFFNGVFLKDPKNVLMSASEGKTKALRQWRFNSIQDIDADRILEYVFEAIQNEREGIVWQVQKNETLSIPEIFANVLDQSINLTTAFTSLSKSKQNEYLDFITSAKHEETKLTRIEKVIPLILAGQGLNDKYKKC